MKRREFAKSLVAGLSLSPLIATSQRSSANRAVNANRHPEDELLEWPYRSYNRGRWDNDYGTLNLIGPKATRRGVTSIQTFDTFGLGAPLRTDDVNPASGAYTHEITEVGPYSYARQDESLQVASDRITVNIHGMTNTHIDAFSHLGHNGTAFNNLPFEEVVSSSGASRFSIMDNPGVATRAWFVDVPRARGIEALIPGVPVVASDLEFLEGFVEPGDALVIRTGRYATNVVSPNDPLARDNHGNWSGLHFECMDLIASWDVGIVATDSSGDNFPSTSKECSVPIHIIAEAYLGMPLVHHLELEQIAKFMANRISKNFLFVVAPLRISGGTGSPVNPIGIV